MSDSTGMQLFAQAEVVDSPSVVEQLTRGEVDMQVATAKRWARSLTQFRQSALAMAAENGKIAGACFYVLPRGGKKIEGPSIRLAEIVAQCWGNLRCESRVLGSDATTVTAQATAWDMQSNVLVRKEVRRRITDSEGRRYNDDMIIMTGNAACSIALRNAIFTVVPQTYVASIFEHCKKVAAGERGTLEQARAHWLKWWEEKGAPRERIFELLGRKGAEEITVDDINTLQGLSNALNDGGTSLEDLFGTEPQESTGTRKFGFKARQAKGAKPSAQEVTESIPHGDKP